MAQAQWKDARCILCHGTESLSLEHVIPQSLGGILTCRFLCQKCNSAFGKGFEAQARLAPELRNVAGRIEGIGDLSERLEIGASYTQKFGQFSREVRLRKDGELGISELGDGSIISSEKDFSKQITQMLRRRGAGEDDIATVIDAWKTSGPSSTVDLDYGLAVRNWSNHPATPTYEELPLNALVPLKIAVEFCALVVGSAIYYNDAKLNCIKQILIEQDQAEADKLVVRHTVGQPRPFHGILFQGNRPEASFQVRLFGYLTYVVRLPGVVIPDHPCAYTHNLKMNEESFRFV